MYHSALPVLFGVKKYADALWKVVESREIEVYLNSALVGVNPERKEATFENLHSVGKGNQVIVSSVVLKFFVLIVG